MPYPARGKGFSHVAFSCSIYNLALLHLQFNCHTCTTLSCPVQVSLSWTVVRTVQGMERSPSRTVVRARGTNGGAVQTSIPVGVRMQQGKPALCCIV
jgi:hypothetical protein